jgi:TetR/AcrR family transcriptional repressor of nem operon
MATNNKEMIIGETLRLFSAKGYCSTSIHDILQATGLSKGGLYNYFKSKDDLFSAVLETARRIWRERCLHGVDTKKRPIRKIRKILQNYRDRYLKDWNNFPGGCIFIVLTVELSNQKPDLAHQLQGGFAGLKNLFRRLLDENERQGQLRSDTSPEAAAEIIFNGMLGASLMYGITRSNEDLDRAIESLLAYLDSIDIGQKPLLNPVRPMLNKSTKLLPGSRPH